MYLPLFTYEYTNNKPLSPKKEVSLVKYLKENKENLIPINNFIFDSKSLQTPILLSKCLDCEKYQKENCCPGPPYSMPNYQRKDLEPIVPNILSFMPEGQISDKILNNPQSVFTKGNSFTSKGNRENRCLFSFHHNNTSKCAIHLYCITNNLNPIKYKPLICSLFPLFAVHLPSDKIIFFCHNKETEPFSLYWYSLTQRPCVNTTTLNKILNSQQPLKSKYLLSLNKDNIIQDNIQKDYLPSWKSQESVLRYLLSDTTYNILYDKLHH